jgi:hypothetical protein
MALDDNQVRDLLFGETDVRELTLFLAQQSLTMDAVERDQRLIILQALNAHRTGELAVQTAKLARETSRIAKWTRIVALATLLLAIATVVLAILQG